MLNTIKNLYLNQVLFHKRYLQFLISVHKIKEVLRPNKTTYVDMCILHLSKPLKYDFHCNYLEKKYGHKAVLLFRDTGSLTYETETYDEYEGFC